MKKSPAFLALALCTAAAAQAQTLPEAREAFLEKAQQLRQNALLEIEPTDLTTAHLHEKSVPSKYPWKERIVTTVFTIGKSTAWDPQWHEHFGGADQTAAASRRGFRPSAFTPRQNPFYIALPYNDVTGSATKPEAKLVIPWFKEGFVEEGKSVCRDRWIAIRNLRTSQICYAQWSDCGPFSTDHWQYVFGPALPKPNANHGSGMSVSPAVRDYLDLARNDVTNWKFIDAREVPDGPWAQWGDNNSFVKNARLARPRVDTPPALPPPNIPTYIPSYVPPNHDYLDPANNARPVHKSPLSAVPPAR